MYQIKLHYTSSKSPDHPFHAATISFESIVRAFGSWKEYQDWLKREMETAEFALKSEIKSEM